MKRKDEKQYGEYPTKRVILEIYDEMQRAMERYVRTRLYARQRPYETLVEKSLIAFGSPEDVIRVARLYQEAGYTDYLAIMNFGGLPQARVLRSMELMARHVLPAFHR